jgi:hypothetical protein
MMKKAPTINGVPMACCSQICDDEFMEINFGSKPRRSNTNYNYTEEVITSVEDLGRSDEYQLKVPSGAKAMIYVNGCPVFGPIIGEAQISVIEIEYY